MAYDEELLKILHEAEEIADDMKLNYDTSNGEEMASMLERMSAHLGRIPQLASDAEYYFNLKCAEVTNEMAEKKIQATYMREILKGKTATEQRIMTFVERTYSTLKVKIDAIRSSLSFLKAELSQFGNGQKTEDGPPKGDRPPDDFYERQNQ
jgi:hypothetical protein